MTQFTNCQHLLRVARGDREGYIRRHHKRRPSPLSAHHTAEQFLPQNKIAELAKGEEFRDIDLLVAHNMSRVAHALRGCSVGRNVLSEHVLDEVVAKVMGTEAALSRVQLLSGTHAITVGLFSCLSHSDELLCVTGGPYDTLEEVLGIRGEPGIGNLADWGITSRCHYGLFTAEGKVDPATITESINVGVTRVVHIQRSCGYSLRPTLTIEDIQSIVRTIQAVDDSIIVSVDNCYGEFTEVLEPGHAGADLVMGSFIKNPGGTIAAGGGYIAGREAIVHRARVHLGQHGGAHKSNVHTKQLLHGLCIAPSSVGEALKGGRLLVHVAQDAGISATPLDSALKRPSFITALQLGSADAMVQFCQMVQANSPVGSYVLPVGAATPGYESSVVFADGTFVNGSTAELSADGPLRHPYVVYCQGGAHWIQWLQIASFLSSHTVSD